MIDSDSAGEEPKEIQGRLKIRWEMCKRRCGKRSKDIIGKKKRNMISIFESSEASLRLTKSTIGIALLSSRVHE